MKRSFDVLFSLSVLLFFFPLYVAVALAIKSTSKGPIFYRALRVGRGGIIFSCWKFRTMFQDADRRLKEMLAKSREMREEWEKYWKLKEDPRVTAVGKILRKTSLDELPQFWNVLMGELSVVGPRPVTFEEITKYYGDKAEKILSLRPGITGLWQTSGRSLLTFEERVLLEESYVEKRSFLLDLKLIAKTVPSIFFSKEAF